MNAKSLLKSMAVLVIAVLILSACEGQGTAAPTVEATQTAPAASPTPSQIAGIETPIAIAGAELKITLATTDKNAYESGPFSVQTDPGTALMHIEAAIVSGQPDFTVLNKGVSLTDGQGKDCPLVSSGVEKPLWEFFVPDTEKSFTLKFGDGQTVVLDSIVNKVTAAAPAAEPTSIPTATVIPPTPEPATLIRLGPGKYGKAMWLEVLKGEYQIVGGSTLLAGSAIGVNEDWLILSPGLAIDIEGAVITLKGDAYPSGTKWLVDASGNLVPREGSKSAAPVETEVAPLEGYTIPAGVFPMDDMIDCRTDVSIIEVNTDGFQVNGNVISMHKDRFVIWCPGAKHTWVGKLTYKGYTFDSDTADPLQFTVDPQGGYEYIGGKGQVTQPDGTVVSFPEGKGAVNEPIVKPTTAPTKAPTADLTEMRKEIFPTVFLLDTFDDNNSNWSVGDVEGQWWTGTRLIKNGVLDWNGTSKQAMTSTVSPEKPSYKNHCSSQELGVRVKNFNPGFVGSYGLRLMSPDESSSYAFLLSPEGYFAFFLTTQNDTNWKPLIDWKVSPYIKNGDWNKLSIQAQGSHFKLFINDMLVGEAEDSTISSSQGSVFIAANEAGAKIQIQFDTFEIRLPASEKEAGCPLEISSAADPRFSRVLISDNFNDSSKGWPEGRVTTVYWKGTRTISDGIYTTRGVSASNMYTYAYTENGSSWDKNISDQRSSVRVRLVNPSMDGDFGMTLRLDDSGSNNNFYTFMIDSNGFASFFKVYNDNWTPLMDWTVVEGLSANNWNTLAAEASGSHFRLFINDALVGEVDDSTLKEGRTALFIEAYKSSVSFEVQFDDFEIRLPQ